MAARDDDGWEAVPRRAAGGFKDIRHTTPLLRVYGGAGRAKDCVTLRANVVATQLLFRTLHGNRLVLESGGPGRLAVRAPREDDPWVVVRTLCVSINNTSSAAFSAARLAKPGEVFVLQPPDADGRMVLMPVTDDDGKDLYRPGRARVIRSGARYDWRKDWTPTRAHGAPTASRRADEG